ncbi:hypothetical protein BX257_4037 [Streptomyces sp. 3212.3]|uniref:hypothetical protein n=1 Tax=Streptomyces sp. 3212.3 TaxID=1938846 RepID=UPI000E39F744|nr:hypothetical protein [Streptomyces sp. 3212.3]REE61458.1 hypothetical protein BX257_4037 [Streptomyces sp. 3212.3]
MVLNAPATSGGPRANWNVGVITPKGRARESGSEGFEIEFSKPAPTPFFFTDVAGARWFRDARGDLYEWSDAIERRFSEQLGIVMTPHDRVYPAPAPDRQLTN